MQNYSKHILLSIFVVLLFSCSDVDEAQKALSDAKNYAQKGEYAKALEKHVWFHNNALKIRPSYYGVRLSFALDYWVSLGAKYPEALEKLREIRDQKTSRLLSGEYDRELFHDVEAINYHLGVPYETVNLFELLDLKNPKFAASVYDIASKSLFEAEKYVIARKYLGDPLVRLERAKENYLSGIEFSKKRGNDSSSRGAFERIFTNEVVRLIIILDKSGERKNAMNIQALALEIKNDEAIKNALRENNTGQQF